MALQVDQDYGEARPRASTASVLVVDDEAPIVTVATEILQAAGYDAVGVTSAAAALDQPPGRFDVLVTDFKMPQLDGLALFDRLRQTNPHLVGVLVTGFGNVGLVQTAMRAGFSGILLKPFPLQRLTAAVERAIKQRRITEENYRLGAVLEIYGTRQDLTKPRTRGELAAVVAVLARRITAASAGAALLVDSLEGNLTRPAETDPVHWPPWAADLLGQPADELPDDAPWTTGETIRLTVPLTFGERPEGVLVLELPEPLDPLQTERLLLLAHQAALALSHLRLFENRLREEKLALVGRMAGAICDRVRAPLRAIEDAVQSLGLQGNDYVGMIHDEAERLEVMCSELSDLISGTDTLVVRPQSAQALLEDVARRVRSDFLHRGITIRMEADGDALVELDERKIGRALHNLVKNAAEAMPDGGILTLGLVLEPGVVVISVADTGSGMSPEVLDRLFEPFFTHGKSGGTGLGGSIVRSAVRAHGGDVQVCSRLGQGTTFTLVLPREQPRPYRRLLAG